MGEEKTSKQIVWKDEAGIEQAEQLKKELLEAFDSASEVHLDISEVNDLDISAIQLVLAAYKESEKRNVPFSINAPIPDVIDKFFKSCGVSLGDLNQKTVK